MTSDPIATEHRMTTDTTPPRPEAQAISGRENLEQTGREALSAAQARTETLKAEAEDAMAAANAEALRRTEAAKGRTAEEISRTAHGLETAAAELEGSPFQQDLLREAAGGLEQLSRAVDGRSIAQMTGDLSDFARRNPVGFLGGAALAGFALARFARADRPETREAFDGFSGGDPFPTGASPTTFAGGAASGVSTAGADTATGGKPMGEKTHV